MNGLGHGVDALARWFSGTDSPGGLAITAAILLLWVAPLLLIVFPIASVAQIIERKVAAAIQRRVGPNSAGFDGPLRFGFRVVLWFLPRATQDRCFERFTGLPGVRNLLEVARRLGLGQLAADGIKMLGKEDIIPSGADGAVFRMAPYLALLGAFLPFCAVPFSQHVVMLEIPVGAVYAVAVAGISVMALLMAGWGSGSKWSLLGGMRAVAQMVSYEVPVGLAIAGVVLWSGTMDLHAIVAGQYQPGVLSFAGWNLLQSPFLALLGGIFLLAGLAECQRTPFDMAEAESELVSGFNTEYSGLRWGMFALAEYSEMILIGAIFTTLFLGGYQSPLCEEWIVGLHPLAESLVHVTIFTLKCLLILFCMIWVRWTLPRFRVDQVMRLCWLTLVPLCLVSLLGVAFTMLAVGAVEPGVPYGRLPAQPGLATGLMGTVLAWLVPLVPGVLLVVAARRKHGSMHPALRELTGGGS